MFLLITNKSYFITLFCRICVTDSVIIVFVFDIVIRYLRIYVYWILPVYSVGYVI
jgi:hypothetical protein